MAIGINSLQGIISEDSWQAWNVSGSPAQTDVGKAVTLDSSAANTVKLAGIGDRIIGRLEALESRTIEGVTVGTISREFSDSLPAANGETFHVGDTAVGASSGTVKVLKNAGVSAPDWSQNIVVAVLTDGTPIVQLS